MHREMGLPRRLVAGMVLALLLGACGDAGPRSSPGSVEVRVASPNGAEGSAVVAVFGEGIRGVSTDVPGDLRFALSMADTTTVLQGVVLQVADGEDRLRSTVGGYTLEFLR